MLEQSHRHQVFLLLKLQSKSEINPLVTNSFQCDYIWSYYALLFFFDNKSYSLRMKTTAYHYILSAFECIKNLSSVRKNWYLI